MHIFVELHPPHDSIFDGLLRMILNRAAGLTVIGLTNYRDYQTFLVLFFSCLFLVYCCLFFTQYTTYNACIESIFL